MPMQPALRIARSPHRNGFAVLLNANARQVDGGVRRAVEAVARPEHVYLSHDAEEASAIVDEVLSRGYQTVFTGGGDGTFVGWVNQILDEAARRGVAAPRFGVLALGTGNAVAEVVGAKQDERFSDLVAFASGAARELRRLELLTCEGRRTPFSGVGIDAAVINDYRWLKSRLGSTALARLGMGISGYGLAVALRSAPRCLVERRPSYCEVVNVGAPAFRLDARGRPAGPPIEHGELLYAGPCMMAAASTVPFYGFRLKAFPFAGARPGTMQLRIATQLSVASVLWNVPRIWSGEFKHRGLLDFHAERVSIQFERPMPLQTGGDAEGWRESVTFGMAPEAVELVDFAASARRPHLLH